VERRDSDIGRGENSNSEGYGYEDQQAIGAEGGGERRQRASLCRQRPVTMSSAHNEDVMSFATNDRIAMVTCA